MDIQLIAMDLDGTTLQQDHCSFSPKLLTVLEQAHSKGILIVPVTGRQFGLLPPILSQHHSWKKLAVLCNGGQIRNLNTGEMLHSLEIDPVALQQLLALADEFNLPIEFSMDSKLYLTAKSFEHQLPYPNLVFHRDTILAQHGVIVPSLKPMCTCPIEKVNLLCIPSGLGQVLEQRLQEIAVSAVWASSSSMEITHPDATKGNGLQQLCKLLDIPMSAVMALGDSGNDITMLQQAGLGVAMGNAPDFVKAAADICVAPYDEDGAACAIEQHIL